MRRKLGREEWSRRQKRKRKIYHLILVSIVVIFAFVGVETATAFYHKGESESVSSEIRPEEALGNETQDGEEEALREEQQEESQEESQEGNESQKEEEASESAELDEAEGEEDETETAVSVQCVGTSEAGMDYAYDAEIIAEKLLKYDYSNNGDKIVFLTFDDGASTTVTPKILKVLAKYEVKATFFVTGSNIERGGDQAKELIQEEFDQGHAIANHSYSHDYSILYPNRTLNLTKFLKDYKKTDRLLKEILGDGFSTRVIRCPGGFMSWNNMSELSEYMEENDMVSIDWNALSKDAEGAKKTASQLLENVKETSKNKEIVVLLMHDTYGKEETVKALPQIIEYFQENGYAFKTLV